MDLKHESLCHCADSSCNKTDAARVSQVLKPTRYDLRFIILLYFVTVQCLILSYHGVLAGMGYSLWSYYSR